MLDFRKSTAFSSFMEHTEHKKPANKDADSDQVANVLCQCCKTCRRPCLVPVLICL